MSDDNNNQTAASNTPSHIVSIPQESGGKTYWTRIGAGWQHKRGGGVNFRLIANPIVAVLGLTRSQIRAFLGLKTRLRRPIPALARLGVLGGIGA